MLSNAYFLAKFRFDTAENEPAKNLQNFRKMHFRKMHPSRCGPEVYTVGIATQARTRRDVLSEIAYAADEEVTSDGTIQVVHFQNSEGKTDRSEISTSNVLRSLKVFLLNC